jgi:HSP20 family protein
MRSRVQAVVLPSEVGEFADEVRRIFLELGRTFGLESLAGECSPALDVFETDRRVEIAVDLPGVDPAAVRIILKGPSVLIAGEKTVRRGLTDSSFHLVERGFGRFARAVRLSCSCDSTSARATLVNGELRISIPKVADRRGQPIRVPISAG